MICPNCQFINPPEMRFCGNCGTPFPDSQAAGKATLEDLSDGWLLGMLSPEQQEKLRRARLEAAGQRRQAVVMKIAFSGPAQPESGPEGERPGELVQQYANLVANAIYKYEGVIDRFTQAGVSALFGAPVAYENSAEMAALAALEIQANFSRFGDENNPLFGLRPEAKISLHAGYILIDPIQNTPHLAYTALGDSLSLSEKLIQAASPGMILVSDWVYRQTGPQFEYQEKELALEAGAGLLTRCYQLLSIKMSPGGTRGKEGSLWSQMIGRDGELLQIERAFQRTIGQDQGQFVLLSGEAGIGKSRLVAEFKRLVGQEDVFILEGQGLAYQQYLSYSIFLNLLRNHLGLLVDFSEAQVRDQLLHKADQLLGERAAEVTPYLQCLFGVQLTDPADEERISYLEPSQLRQQIFLAVRDLLLAQARQGPLVLILEDFHWADHTSIELLQFLLASFSQAPVLVIAISRPFEFGALGKLLKWSRQNLGAQFVSIQLQNLTAEESEQLLYQLLSIPDLPESLRDTILQRSAGIPFYLEEILRMLMDQQLIRREKGRWSLAPHIDTASLGVPATLQELILARFDQLDMLQRAILQAATVLGHQFSLPLLKTVLVMEDEKLRDEFLFLVAFSLLMDRAFLIPCPESANQEYRFKQVLVSDTIYNTLLKRERSHLHGIAAEAIETLYANRLDEQIEILANHYQRSPNLERALHYLLLAGQKASREYANSQARQYFEQALALLTRTAPTPEQALQVRMGLGNVLVFIGEYATALEQYQEALNVIAGSGSGRFTQERSELYRRMSAAYERQGDYNQAIQSLALAQQALDEIHIALPIERALILNDTGWINFRQGNLEDAEQRLVQALALIENTGKYDVLASIYNRLGGVYYQKDQVDLASEYVGKSLKLREEIGDIVGAARSCNNLGLLSWKRGEWNQALENFKRSVALHANLGDVEGMIELHSNLGLLLIDQGESEEAQKHLSEALAKAQEIGHSYHIGLIYLYFSHLFVAAENWQVALAYGDRSIDIFREIGVLDHLADVYTHIGLAWLGQGNLEQAQKWGKLALEAIQQGGPERQPSQAEVMGRAYRLLGETALQRGETAEAARLFQESEQIFRQIGNQLELGRTAVAQAALAMTDHNTETGRALLASARQVFQKLGARADLLRLDRNQSLSG